MPLNNCGMKNLCALFFGISAAAFSFTTATYKEVEERGFSFFESCDQIGILTPGGMGIKYGTYFDDGKFGNKVLPQGRTDQVSGGGEHLCFLRGENVSCMRNYGEPLQSVPSLKNPRFISSGSGFTCALDADGVKCWVVAGSTSGKR